MAFLALLPSVSPHLRVRCSSSHKNTPQFPPALTGKRRNSRNALRFCLRTAPAVQGRRRRGVLLQRAATAADYGTKLGSWRKTGRGRSLIFGSPFLLPFRVNPCAPWTLFLRVFAPLREALLTGTQRHHLLFCGISGTTPVFCPVVISPTISYLCSLLNESRIVLIGGKLEIVSG